MPDKEKELPLVTDVNEISHDSLEELTDNKGKEEEDS